MLMKPLLASLLLGAALAAPVQAAAEPKVLRYAIRIAESGFDPAQISDMYSTMLAAGIYEPPLQYAYLARPIQLKPLTAEALPEVSADFKTLTFRIRKGIHFADDPAFGGKKRELTAADYLYAIKRHYDPVNKSSKLYVLENAGVLGLSELRRELIKARKPFDYDREVEGLRQIDRYSFQVRTAHGSPRFINQFADVMMGAVAREVVEAYGQAGMMEHPVGTGPWRLSEWRRSSRMVFTKNPNFRDEFYDEQPPGEDARLVAQAARLKGRKLPMVDRVEVSVIEQSQPRWLSFLNGEADMLDDLPSDFASIAIPRNKLAPTLARDGVQMIRYPRADNVLSYFAMENPVVGGYEPAKVALRRAISLGIDLDREIRLTRKGQGMPAQGLVGPQIFGFEPGFKSEMSEFDRARARALLDMHGYLDRDGDGWREQPDGSPLLIEYATQPDAASRALTELWAKNMAALNIRIKFNIAQWPENLKASTAGKLMMWGVSWTASIPDGEDFLDLGYGPNKGQANHARFDLPAYNALYERQLKLPNGPERQALITEMQRLLVAYMPYKGHVHRVFTDLARPWVMGYNRNIFWPPFWQYVDIDTEALKR